MRFSMCVWLCAVVIVTSYTEFWASGCTFRDNGPMYVFRHVSHMYSNNDMVLSVMTVTIFIRAIGYIINTVASTPHFVAWEAIR